MDKMDLITKVIPGLLVVGIVWFNMRKLQRNLNAMKQQHCSGSCHNCAHSAGCTSAQKKIQIKKHKIL